MDWVEPRHGLRVHGGLDPEELKALGLSPSDVLDLSVNVNPYGPSPAVMEAIRTARVDQYPDPAATPVREAIAARAGLPLEQVVFGAGAADLLWTLARVLLSSHRRLLIVEPAFSELRAAAEQAGAEIRTWRTGPEQGFRVDLQAVAAAALEVRADVVALCAPTSPAGTPLPVEEVARLAQRLAGKLVLLDESFLSLSDGAEDLARPLPENVLRLRSLTKAHAIPGLRAGYLLATPAIARAVERSRPAWSTSSLAQAAALAALGEEPFVERCRRRLRDDRETTASALRALGLRPVPSSAPYLIFPAGDAAALRRRLLSRGVLIRDCASFGLPAFVRVAARPAEDRARLLAALKEGLPMIARTLMIQGTASSVGKSLLVTGLCRAFSRAGLRVAPFKSQNMALNAAVAEGGGEIGRAQAVQAEAAGIAPTVDMNPILLKPEGDRASQVVVLGRPIGSLRASEYHARKPELRSVVAEALARLRARVDLVVIEGAGSPAEVNLKEHDLVNMHVARIADAPVVLVGDIDRGGVFASLVGTLELLDPEERARVAGLVINKFRGERALLEPGLEFLARRTGVPVLGVLPYLPDLRIADEDSVALDERRDRAAAPGELAVVVVRLPRISNHDDLQPFDHEPGVALRYATRPEELAGADLVILPGSKGTVADLRWLRQTGIAAAIAARAERGEPVLGICGGCQMLGVELLDPVHAESSQERVEGLGLLPFRTRFGSEKITAQVRGRLAAASILGDRGAEVAGYEIHLGELEGLEGAVPALEIESRNGQSCRAPDGAVDPRRPIAGTLVHGLFEDPRARAALLGQLRSRRGLAAPEPSAAPTRDAAYDRLARSVVDHLDWPLLCKLAGLDAPAMPSFPVRGAPAGKNPGESRSGALLAPGGSTAT